MRRLKILSRLIDWSKVRPLTVVAMAVILVDLIYVNSIYQAPGLSALVKGSGTSAINVVYTGKVREKAFDDTGSLKSITVGKIVCYVNQGGDSTEIPTIGSTVTVRGSIREIEGPMNPGEFNRKNYYRAKGVFYDMNAESVETLRVPAIPVREWFLNLRLRISARIRRFFRLEGDTVNTLICGDKIYLPKERKDLYTGVGVGHFLVISGLHISAVGTFIYRGLRRLGLKIRTGSAVAMIFLILYGITVGFSVSVIRATVMFFIRLMADVLKRNYDMLNAVAFAAIINMVINPMCVTDTAFIYSYMTVLAIAIYVTFLSKAAAGNKTLEDRVKGYLRFPLILWLFIMPVNLSLSYECSVASIVINAFLAPLSAPILILSFAGLGLSYTGLAVPVGVADFLIALMLRGFDKLCKLALKYPLFTVLGKPAVWKICLYYVLLLMVLFRGREVLGNVLKVGLVLGLITLVATPANLSGRVTTLYVGQGECVVVHVGPGSAVIYDCGSTSKSNVGEYTVIPYLRYTGVSRVEAVFVSHGDFDHVGEVPYLIKNLSKEGIRLRRLYTQDIPKTEKSRFLLEAETVAQGEGVQVLHLSKGQSVRHGAFSFACVWPGRNYVSDDANEGSMVIVASRGEFDAILCGDATGETERRIIGSVLKASVGNIEFLSVSHHGSKSASDEAFLRAVSPVTAVISAGINNRYGHPHGEVLKRFKQYAPNTILLRTDRKGAISVSPVGRRVIVTTFLN